VFIIILKRKTENPESGNKSSDEVDISQPRTLSLQLWAIAVMLVKIFPKKVSSV
jgi:hypothetical protein